MDETGDQFESQSISNGIKSLDINCNSTQILNDLIEEMKDKCESLVNKDDNNKADNESLDMPTADTHLLRRDNDSEAEEENQESVDCRSDGPTDERKDDIIKDKSSYDQTIKVTVVSTECNEEESTKLTLHSRPFRTLRPKTEKWGESVGIVDEKGRNKRVISLDELHNYLILEYRGQRVESKIYCSLINDRYPRFFDSTIEYYQRWRMRYNIFVDKVLADKSDESLVHIGELHLYFDLMPKYSTPYYVNNSFYSNPNDTEKPLDLDSIMKIESVMESLRKSQSIYQLRFPIRTYLFNKTDHIFDKFKERHHELMDESRSVHRKATLRKQKQMNTGVPQSVSNRGMSRSDRDFGQSSRDFHQTGRPFHRNQRKFNEIGSGFAPNEGQESNEMQKDFGGYRRGSGRRGARSFVPTDRKPFNRNDTTERRRRRDTESSTDMDVMFEDTRERHERNGVKSTFVKPNKLMNRNDRTGEQRMDSFRDRREPIFAHKERNFRNNNRPMDSDVRRHNRDGFRGKDNHFPPAYTPATGALFSATDLETIQRTNSGPHYGQMAPGFGRYGAPHN